MVTNSPGTTPDGRRFQPRENIQDPGECADCGKHVDPNDPALYTRLANTGLESRTDEQGLRDDEELAVRGNFSAMGGETLDDSPGRPLDRTDAPAQNPRLAAEESVNADAAVWDGSCYHCGAAADRVGRSDI